jgi:acyl-CoA synthetase (AMP-forming)/AMP-acid ligase II
MDGALARDPGAEALVTASGRLSYAELDALADRAAGALYGIGVRPGDRVGASLPNDLDIVGAFHGAMRIGAIWVGVNRALAPPERAYILSDSAARVALVEDPATWTSGSAGARLFPLDEWRDAVASSPGRPQIPRPDPLEPAGIGYTSGTTGFPKGAVHCQAGLLQPGAAALERRAWGPELRKGDSLPLTILNMMVLTTLLTSQVGATSVIIDNNDVVSIARWIREEKVSLWNGPPAQLHTMAYGQDVQPSDLASLVEVWVGGGDCPDRLRDDFQERFGVRVARTYGLTESPALVCLDDVVGDPPPGTSGKALGHLALEIDGEEIVLGPTADGPWAGRYRPLLGYWNQPEASAKVLREGKLHTGDLGSLDPSGHLRVIGRMSQVIIRGGANVYPAEVERVLVAAPGVNACSVVGVPDPRLGERVGAAIELLPGEAFDRDAVLAHCRSQLAGYKVPERWVVVDSLPRNQMGKVPPAAVREMLAGSL